MEAMEQATTAPESASAAYVVTKGKRTKRRRLPLLNETMPISSTELSSSATEEEEDEDIANCLILLSQGRHTVEHKAPAVGADVKFRSRRFTEAATTTDGKAGFYVYECKTCNKCFPSFQALGGHRTSHNKPKAAVPIAAEQKKWLANEDGLNLSIGLARNKSFSNVNVGGKQRVHQCYICGWEFASGQALGGHMRRHRPVSMSEQRNVGLALDLNMPPPKAEEGLFKPPPSVVFSASAAMLGGHLEQSCLPLVFLQ